MLGNIAWHGPEACELLVQHKVLQSIVPILKSSDVELLNLSLDFSGLALGNTEQVFLSIHTGYQETTNMTENNKRS